MQEHCYTVDMLIPSSPISDFLLVDINCILLVFLAEWLTGMMKCLFRWNEECIGKSQGFHSDMLI